MENKNILLFQGELRGKYLAVNGFGAFVLRSAEGLIGKLLPRLLLSVYSPAVASLSGSSFDSVSLLFNIYLTATFNQCQYDSKLNERRQPSALHGRVLKPPDPLT